MVDNGLLVVILFAPVAFYLVLMTPALWWMERREPDLIDRGSDDQGWTASRS